MSKPIFIATHPNFEKDDKAIVSKNLFSYKKNKYDSVIEFENIVGEYFYTNAIAFDSARSSLYVLLKNLDLPKNSEVILPAFSCMVVANAVKWVGLKTVFVDCNKENYNYDLEDLVKKISSKTKVILIQHTFGHPEDMEKIEELCKDQIFIIEDLAHSLGGSYNGKKLGTFGDAAILTFGIEKVISSIRGGMLLVKDNKLSEKIRNYSLNIKDFPNNQTFTSLLGVNLWKIFTPIYYFGIGKVTLGKMMVFIAHKLGLMGNMIEDCEYDTCQPSWLPSKMSPTLAILGINQFKKLERLNDHRINISKIYSKELEIVLDSKVGTKNIYIRFPLILERRDELLKAAKANKIVLGDWYKNILYAPVKTLEILGYIKGSCPNAEYLSKRIVNLPTHIKVNEDDAIRISNLVKKYL